MKIVGKLIFKRCMSIVTSRVYDVRSNNKFVDLFKEDNNIAEGEHEFKSTSLKARVLCSLCCDITYNVLFKLHQGKQRLHLYGHLKI